MLAEKNNKHQQQELQSVGGDSDDGKDVPCDKDFQSIPAKGLFMSQCNPVRRAAIRVVTWMPFDYIMLSVILANCVTLAMDSNRPGFEETTMAKNLLIVSFVFLGWNILDFIAVSTGYLALGPIGNYTAVRAVRVLWPLRTISRIKEMRVLVETFIGALPLLGNVLYLVAFYFAVFGIITTHLFNGKLNRRCAQPDFSGAYVVVGSDGVAVLQNVTYPNEVILNENPSRLQEAPCGGPSSDRVVWLNDSVAKDSTEGLNGELLAPVATGVINPSDGSLTCASEPYTNYGEFRYGTFCAPYINPDIGGWRSYDNILLSCLVIFQHITFTDYVFNMYDTQEGVNWWTWPLHLAMVIIGGYMLASLALAVLEAEAHGMLPEELDDTPVSPVSNQNDFDTDFEETGNIHEGREGAWSKFCSHLYVLQSQKWFSILNVAIIVSNGITLGLNWYKMPIKLEQATEIINITFTIYFVIEVTIRLLGQGWRQMNQFHFLFTLASVVDLIVALAPETGSGFKDIFTWKRLYLVIHTVLLSFS
eukprot:gene1590-32978_t